MADKKQIRRAFRNAVFKRDGYRCAMCGKPGKDRQGADAHLTFHSKISGASLLLLDAHHITERNDMPDGGYFEENGISLCDGGCHLFAESITRRAPRIRASRRPISMSRLARLMKPPIEQA